MYSIGLTIASGCFRVNEVTLSESPNSLKLNNLSSGPAKLCLIQHCSELSLDMNANSDTHSEFYSFNLKVT